MQAELTMTLILDGKRPFRLFKFVTLGFVPASGFVFLTDGGPGKYTTLRSQFNIDRDLLEVLLDWVACDDYGLFKEWVDSLVRDGWEEE